MYQLCLLEPALFRFLHDAPRSELLIDLALRIFFMPLRGHLLVEFSVAGQQNCRGAASGNKSHEESADFESKCRVQDNANRLKK